MMGDLSADAAMVLCILIVWVYAKQRLNTPPKNRSSTRRITYLWAVSGYVTFSLLFFMVLTLALGSAPMKDLLFKRFAILTNLSSDLPPPILAMLLLTTLIRLTPYIKELDASRLEWFLSRANIPKELVDRAATLTPELFGVEEADLPKIAAMIDSCALPEELKNHLRAEPGHGLAGSQHRLTGLLTGYSIVTVFSRVRRCRLFFSDYSDEWNLALANFGSYCEAAAAGLREAKQLSADLISLDYEIQMQRWRQDFIAASNRLFSELVVFISGAVLALDKTEAEVGRRLRAIGFDIQDQEEKPVFPTRDLTFLAFVTIAVSFFVDPMLPRPPAASEVQPDWHMPFPRAAAPVVIVVLHMTMISLTVWMLQRSGQNSGTELRWELYACICAVTLLIDAHCSDGYFPPAKPYASTLG